MYYYYDYSWFVLIPAMIFTFICQARINSAYRTYSQVRISTGITGAEAARMMMNANGLENVAINVLNGGNALTNYYDPQTKSLNLSRDVYSSPSVASVCIACHEVGHAIQDDQHYALLAFRNGIVPVVNLTQMVSWPLIFFGLIASLAVLFQLVTLPVEFDASRRALKTLEETGLLTYEELGGGRKVLKAAAMTYVAALATAVASLLRVLLISRRN